MPNNIQALKRQIEILAYFCTKRDGDSCYDYDLAEKYFVSEITIRRDLNELRAKGIPINSLHGKGIEITGKIQQKILSDFIIKYIAHFNSEIIVSRAFDYLLKNGMQAINIISELNSSIENNSYVLLEVNSPQIGKRSLKVLPYKIIDNNGTLEIVFIHNSIAQSIIFKHISSANDTNEKNSTDYKLKIREFISQTYNKEESTIKIKLKVSSEVSIKNFEINSINVIRFSKNGQVVVETSESSLDDVAVWAMKQSNNIKVIEPQALINKINDIKEEGEIYDRNMCLEESFENVSESYEHYSEISFPNKPALKDSVQFSQIPETIELIFETEYYF